MFVFVSIQSNSFDVKSYYFCLLKLCIYERCRLPLNNSAHELSCEFLRIVSIFRGKFNCLSLATVAVDVSAET